ncbi:hypothetical protein BT96DRAFT_929893 [Gymnopus androsaceus JB14]|uniref:Uncharacterized protein n=1 Tax=Gymnopus androsaceus JB14 TaxID=1447944 RepID=A0A6A4GCX3_9AGAR|nr:hypothetical protein BT96DRAFT_929893 [Gymnopus androsaceus JB14]
MSLGEAEAKFPTSIGSPDIPPSPTVENPGQLPKLIGNPFLMREAFAKVDHAARERDIWCGSEDENELLRRFRQWRAELDEIRAGQRTRETSKSRSSPRCRLNMRGGMFTD